jgi:hypothetical protein
MAEGAEDMQGVAAVIVAVEIEVVAEYLPFDMV